ncbi:membrane protein [Dyella lipolytica]|uniref:DUF2878 domain-containing protein n=1 Tax=Dyella lipolytica TaxID=1867835 RepID=A0ABW8IZH5_9GAMM|nr:DUF2878 domain-containing protein [Dyella lipolytica]GLQ45960.1 membrane protein [Dyella lipolytica]
MMFWLTLFAYEAVWFCTVSGAGHGLAWPGVLAAAVFVTWRLFVSRHVAVECRLLAVSLVLGAAMETFWVRAGWITYTATWSLLPAPAWILALWACFAFTILPLFGYLQSRPWLAALFGAIGGPLSYAAASDGWHAAHVISPSWHAWCALAVGWGLALPLLTTLARRWTQATATSRAQHRSAL